MPKKAPRAGTRVRATGGRSPSGAREPKPRYPRKSARERGYTWEWEKARKQFLAERPLCEECEAAGIAETATVVDHKIPHRGDQELFWDRSNWRPLCKPCHDAKRGEEKKRR